MWNIHHLVDFHKKQIRTCHLQIMCLIGIVRQDMETSFKKTPSSGNGCAAKQLKADLSDTNELFNRHSPPRYGNFIKILDYWQFETKSLFNNLWFFIFFIVFP